MYRHKEITYTKVVCEVHPQTLDPHRTRIIISGNRICYPGDIITPNGFLEIIKVIINSILSRRNSRFFKYINNFYLETPMEHPDYVCIKIQNIPQEFIYEYKLSEHTYNGWVYFEIVLGCYVLPQAGILANDLLFKRLNKSCYY